MNLRQFSLEKNINLRISNKEAGSIIKNIRFKIHYSVLRQSVCIFLPDKHWQIRMNHCERIEEDKIFMTERKLLLVTEVAQKNAANG